MRSLVRSLGLRFESLGVRGGGDVVPCSDSPRGWTGGDVVPCSDSSLRENCARHHIPARLPAELRAEPHPRPLPRRKPNWRSLGFRCAILLLLMLLAALAMPKAAYAEQTKEVVRVGWFDSPFNIADDHGRRSGYAYEYQQKIAAYAGWTYEYVKGSWPDLLQMLIDGKIDLLSDVSYTAERAEHILYSSLPMGAEEYYLYATSNNKEIDPEDTSTFNGKRIGVNKGSVQIGYFREWARTNNVEAELVELTGEEEDNITELIRGNIDMYLALDGVVSADQVVPISQVGSSDFFFAVSASRPELVGELNSAMNRVQSEDPYYGRTLYAKYLQAASTSHYLSSNEDEWLAEHGAIRVAYQDDYLAFCAQDPKTGELTGALRDCLDVASDCLENVHLDFEPVCFPTAAAAMDAMKNGDVDCVFPTNLTVYDGEKRDVFVTPALMSTDMSAVIREGDKQSFAKKDRITVAVNVDNPNYDLFLQEHFPDWRAIYYKSTLECLQAVADGQADCLLISNYRYNNIARQCEELGLTTWSTGVEMDYCLAVNRDDTVLYSVLTKVINALPPSTVNAALTFYFTEDTRVGVADSIRQNLFGIVLVVAILLVAAALAIVFLLLRGTRMGKKGSAQEDARPTVEDFAFCDDLPYSYSVYRVTHAEHSVLYDAQIVYANHAFERLGGLPAEAVVGHYVRELFPYVGEEWFQNAKRVALDGETVEYDYVDPMSGKTFHYKAWQIVRSGYCAITYIPA